MTAFKSAEEVNNDPDRRKIIVNLRLAIVLNQVKRGDMWRWKCDVIKEWNISSWNGEIQKSIQGNIRLSKMWRWLITVFSRRTQSNHGESSRWLCWLHQGLERKGAWVGRKMCWAIDSCRIWSHYFLTQDDSWKPRLATGILSRILKSITRKVSKWRYFGRNFFLGQKLWASSDTSCSVHDKKHWYFWKCIDESPLSLSISWVGTVVVMTRSGHCWFRRVMELFSGRSKWECSEWAKMAYEKCKEHRVNPQSVSFVQAQEGDTGKWLAIPSHFEH